MMQKGDDLAAKGDLAGAERAYREALRLGPQSREARQALAQILLWQKRYPDAESLLHELLGEDAKNAAAHELLGTSYYWTGAWRKAAREFRRALDLQPGREGARRGLMELRSTMKPRFTLSTLDRSDDQPYDMRLLGGDLTLHSDPLTAWTLSGGSYDLESKMPERDGGAPGSASVPFAQIGVGAAFGRSATGLDLWMRVVDYAAGSTELMGGARLRVPAGGRWRAEVEAGRQELFYTASSMDQAVYVTYGELRLVLDDAAGWYGMASGRWNEYFDDNQGRAFSAYLMCPIISTGDEKIEGAGFRAWLGVSGAYRDTDEARFSPASVTGHQGSGGGYDYDYLGWYDPYYTPMDQTEVRGILAMEWGLGKGVRLKLGGDYGTATEDAVAFSPESGADPLPGAVTGDTHSRDYRPWRAGAELFVPLTKGLGVRLHGGRSQDAYYRADEISATLVGRF